MADDVAQKKPDPTFVDPFQDQPERDISEKSSAHSGPESSKKGYINSSFVIQSNQQVAELSTEFAKAYVVSSSTGAKLYALVFDKRFPVNHRYIEVLKNLDSENICQIVDAGKVKFGDMESYAVVLERPVGKALREVVKSVSFNEARMRRDIIEPLNNLLDEFHETGFCLGNINPDNVFFDHVSGKVTLREPISHFCGFLQLPVYESINRIICLPEAKGNRDPSSDYFALGVLALFVLTGREPMIGVEREKIIDKRLREGSTESLAADAVAGKIAAVNGHAQQLIRGLLNDSDKDRWGDPAVSAWCRNKDKGGPVPPSRVHKETATAFFFDGKEFLSRKYLAYDIQNNWNKAKTSLKISDILRWLKLALKQPHIADLVDAVDKGSSGPSLSDEKISRIIHLLDPDGPIRFHKYSINIWGMGSYIANAFIEGKRESLQVLGSVFAQGLAEQWINIQENSDDYSYSTLLWTPFKIAQYMHKGSLGFGMERCLYTLNPDMACQSKILSKHYVDDLPGLLITLDEMDKKTQEKSDPIDRHSAAFIATRIDLADEIRVKSVQRHPALARNPQIVMLALLAVAQSEARVRTLKGLSAWMKNRVATIADEFNNDRIKRDFVSFLNKSSRSGLLNDLFKTVSDPSFILRDQAGFIEAKRQHRALTQQLSQLGKQSNIEKVAYQYGLRISVMFAYFVLVATLLIIVIRAA